MIVVDTSALVAILENEPEAPALSRCLASATHSSIATPTLVEAAIVLGARHGPEGRQRLATLLETAGVRTVAFEADHAELATDAFARFGRGSRHPARLNYGDCFSYALAKSLDAPLLFKGDDFIHTDIRRALP